jgi:hypothetical protein
MRVAVSKSDGFAEQHDGAAPRSFDAAQCGAQVGYHLSGTTFCAPVIQILRAAPPA